MSKNPPPAPPKRTINDVICSSNPPQVTVNHLMSSPPSFVNHNDLLLVRFATKRSLVFFSPQHSHPSHLPIAPSPLFLSSFIYRFIFTILLQPLDFTNLQRKDKQHSPVTNPKLVRKHPTTHFCFSTAIALPCVRPFK